MKNISFLSYIDLKDAFVETTTIASRRRLILGANNFPMIEKSTNRLVVKGS